MSFNIRQLDNLSYDDVEPLLESYIVELINLFAVSEIGQAHIENYPDGGNWIGTFIEMAYLYGEMTLPKMTKRSAQEVMEYILPRKLTLLDPEDTEDAIPELVAFWNFLKAEYKLRSAGAIAKYLLSIEDKFTQWMFDPAKGGIAKSFILQGTEAGYDMSNQADVEAFQAEYNQQLRALRQGDATETSSKITPLSPNTVPMTAPPPGAEALLNLMGVDIPEEGTPVDPSAFFGKLVGAMEEMGQALNLPDSDLDEIRALQSEIEEGGIIDLTPLSEAAIELLEAQNLTETAPGPIVKDFQVILDAVGPKGLSVSGKRQQIPRKHLAEINQQLTNPIKIDLQRPQQKSYPNIHGLYMLLRATGLAGIVRKGKQHRLVLNTDIYESWQTLNPTERYCTLLEAWMIRSSQEMIDDDKYRPDGEGDFCLQGWPGFAAKKRTYKSYDYHHSLKYYPRYHNLALMELFGLAKITAGKPTKGKGWRIKSVEALPFGDALMTLMRNTYIAKGFIWETSDDPSALFNELQPILQDYFPAWEQPLASLDYPFAPENHIFKVTLGEIWRRIEIKGGATMDQLGNLIRDAVSFDDDHLDQFTYTNPIGRRITIDHPYLDGVSELFTDEVTIGSLSLSVGDTLEYHFDFGANWRFSLLLEDLEPIPEQGGAKVKSTRGRKKPPTAIGRGIEAHGEAPLQYGEEQW
ncbi:MAG: hypothetical protein ACFB16_11955 [Phormidesmis sp.]